MTKVLDTDNMTTVKTNPGVAGWRCRQSLGDDELRRTRQCRQMSHLVCRCHIPDWTQKTGTQYRVTGNVCQQGCTR